MKINRGYGGVFVTCVAFFVLSLRAKFIQGNGSNVADIIGSSANRARNIFAELDNNDGHEAGQEKRDDYDDESDYAKVLELSPLFYEAQRSGKLAPGNRIARRDDSALDDHGNDGEDLTGGYYDAYKRAGQLDTVRETIKRATNYFVKCHFDEFVFYTQVGGFDIDHAYWDRPEALNTLRPAFKIDHENSSSDLAGETSAALAAASLVFRCDVDGSGCYSRRAAVAFCDFSLKQQQRRTPKSLLYIDKSGTLSQTRPTSPLFASRQSTIWMLLLLRISNCRHPPLQLYRAASTSPDRSSRARLAESAGTVRRPAVRTQSDQFRDHLEDFVYSEAMLNYNAGFTSALTGLLQLRIAAK
ncbi:hypothetical protein TKK_0013629 [Trichogramma kaykai]